MPTNTASHTPGPWFHAPLSDDICTTRGVPIACPPENYDEDQWAANAPLLAAAPELLAALKQVEAEMSAGLGSSYGETREQVRRAIAKAEGR